MPKSAGNFRKFLHNGNIWSFMNPDDLSIEHNEQNAEILSNNWKQSNTYPRLSILLSLNYMESFCFPPHLYCTGRKCLWGPPRHRLNLFRHSRTRSLVIGLLRKQFAAVIRPNFHRGRVKVVWPITDCLRGPHAIPALISGSQLTFVSVDGMLKSLVKPKSFQVHYTTCKSCPTIQNIL